MLCLYFFLFADFDLTYVWVIHVRIYFLKARPSSGIMWIIVVVVVCVFVCLPAIIRCVCSSPAAANSLEYNIYNTNIIFP